MVKNNNQVFSWHSPLKSIYDFDVFTSKNLRKSSMLIYVALVIVLISFLNLFRSFIDASSDYEGIESFIFTMIVIPILFLILFSVFHLFLNAYENTKKTYLEGLLVFSSIFVNLFLVAHIIAFITMALDSRYTPIIVALLNLIAIVYFVIIFIKNYVRYANTTGYRIGASIVNSFLIYIIIFIIEIVTVNVL